VGFKCATSSACRHLWRYSVEQRIFFTFTSSAEIPAVVTGGSFFSRGSKVRYSGRVERELALEEVALLAAAAAASNQEHDDGGGSELNPADPASMSSSGATGRRHRSAAYASRRSASEPIRGDDFEDYEDDEEETDDLSFDRPHRSTERNTPNGSRRSRNHDDPLPRQRHHHDQDGSSASASTKTSSLSKFAEIRRQKTTKHFSRNFFKDFFKY
jgi:hypothetical protein